MALKQTPVSVQEEILINKIYLIRGLKVMLDSDLAILYRIDTKHLKRQVRRNPDRFPADFMFGLSKSEYDVLRSQNGAIKICIL